MDKRIVAVAVRTSAGVVYSLCDPYRHHNVLAFVDLKLGHVEQGFLDSDGEFVNRIDAAQIALESGQIKKLQWPPRLYSEDLW